MSFTGRTSPLSVGLRHIQRAAILADPDFRGGDYREHNCFPHKGLSIARQLAMLVYKSWDTSNQRFSWTAQPPYGPAVNSFEIESYLSHQGAKFARDAHTAYDPNCYLLLSKASDLTNLQFRGTKVFQETAARVGESYLDAVLRIRCNLLLFGITSDIVIPISEQTEVFNILRAAGRSNVRLDVHNSPHGHDAFLLDENYFIPKIRQFLASVD
jgi:homoserine O-acetyltransferase